MIDQNRLWELISRKLANEASYSELAELDQLLETDPLAKEMLSLLIANWQLETKTENTSVEKAFEKHIQLLPKKIQEAERSSLLLRHRARTDAWGETVKPKGISGRLLRSFNLLHNYIKFARRSLSRNTTFSSINITGLAIGIACTIVLLLMISYQLSIDQFHKNKDRIYLVGRQSNVNGEIATWFGTPMELMPVLKSGFPQVEEASRYNWASAFILKYQDKRIQTGGMLVDPGFLKIFNFPLLKGNINNVLSEPRNIVITESLSKKLFGNERSYWKNNQDR
ncbi:MAG: ABC transporter permease [Chitinophagaceae bacterium]